MNVVKSKSIDFPNGKYEPLLQSEIAGAGLGSVGIGVSNDAVTLYFAGDLTGAQLTTLDQVIAAHVSPNYTYPNFVESNSLFSTPTVVVSETAWVNLGARTSRPTALFTDATLGGGQFLGSHKTAWVAGAKPEIRVRQYNLTTKVETTIMQVECSDSAGNYSVFSEVVAPGTFDTGYNLYFTDARSGAATYFEFTDLSISALQFAEGPEA